MKLTPKVIDGILNFIQQIYLTLKIGQTISDIKPNPQVLQTEMPVKTG